MKEADERYTPRWIFDTLNLQFDLDPCAPVGGIPYAPVKKYYTEADDGLTKKWNGRVWLNPPFSKPKLFMEKFIDNANGVALVRLSQSQWAKDLWNKADAIVFNDKTLKFIRPDGKAIGIPQVTFLFAFGKQNAEALQNFKEYKVR